MRSQLILITCISMISTYAIADGDDYKNWSRHSFFSKLTEIKTAIETNASEIDDLDSRVQTNTNSIESLQTQVNNLPTGGGTGTNTPDPQTQVNTTAIGDLNTRVQANTNNIGGLTTQVQSNTNAIGANGVLIQSNTAASVTQATQIQTNSDSIVVLTTDMQSLQSTVASQATDVGTVLTDLDTLSTQVQTNTNGISSNSARLDTLEATGTGGGTTPTPTPTFIDFNPYVTTMTTKEFQVINGGACPIAQQQIARTDTATGATIDVTETLTSGARECTTYQFGYVLNANSLSQTSYVNLTLGQSYTFDQAGEILNSDMEPGKSFGFAVVATNNTTLALIQKNTLLGIESVSVPFGNFDNCLKMHTQITSVMMNDVEQVSWICQGVGEVRRIVMDKGINQTRTYNLTNAL